MMAVLVLSPTLLLLCRGFLSGSEKLLLLLLLLQPDTPTRNYCLPGGYRTKIKAVLLAVEARVTFCCFWLLVLVCVVRLGVLYGCTSCQD